MADQRRRHTVSGYLPSNGENQTSSSNIGYHRVLKDRSLVTITRQVLIENTDSQLQGISSQEPVTFQSSSSVSAMPQNYYSLPINTQNNPRSYQFDNIFSNSVLENELALPSSKEMIKRNVRKPLDGAVVQTPNSRSEVVESNKNAATEDSREYILSQLLKTAKAAVEKGIKLEVLAAELNITMEDELSDIPPLGRRKISIQEKSKHIFALRCLLDIGEEKNTSSICPRVEVYSAYILLCSSARVHPFGKSTLGKLIKIAFPNITTKRLGTRGNSKYHYVGLAMRDKIRELLEIQKNRKLPHPLQNQFPQSPEFATNNSQLVNYLVKVPLSVVEPVHNYPQGMDLEVSITFPGYDFVTSVLVDECVESSNAKRFLEILDLSSQTKQSDLIIYLSLLQELLHLSIIGIPSTKAENLKIFFSDLSRVFPFYINNIEREKILGYFVNILKRLVKCGEISLSVSHFLSDTRERNEMLKLLRNLNTDRIADGEVDRISHKRVFRRLLKRDLVAFLYKLMVTKQSISKRIVDKAMSLAQQDGSSQKKESVEPKIMLGLANVTLNVIKDLSDLPIVLVNAHICKVFTSILGEMAFEDSDTFSHWWILHCYITEFMGFIGELYGFRESLNEMTSQ